MDPILGIALSGLLAAQKGLTVAGHNIANVNTPNYSRQRLELAPIPAARYFPTEPGAGVEQLEVAAVRDTLLERMLLAQEPLAGGAARRSQVLAEVEGLFSTDPEASLGRLIGDFFSSFHELARDPNGSAERQGVVHHTQNLCGAFNQIGGRLQTIWGDLVPRIDEAVAEINTLTADICDLNDAIRDSVVHGGAPNDLIDRRQGLLRQLAALLPIDTSANTVGRLDVRYGGQLLVSINGAMPIHAVDVGSAIEIRLADSEATIEPTGGALGNLLDLRHNTLPGHIGHLDQLAGAIIREVNHLHSTGVGRSGGFTILSSLNALAEPGQPLADNGLPFDLEAGYLRILVTDETTGLSRATRVSFDPATDSLADLTASLSAVDHIQATVGAGLLNIVAEHGYRFDFTRRLPSTPDTLGTASYTLSGIYTADADDVYTLTANDSGTIGAASRIEAAPGNTYAGTATYGGAYAGTSNRSYVVEVVDGGDLGTATYRVSEDGGTTWGSTLALAGGTIGVYDDLNGADLGVEASFTNSTFAAGDRFVVHAVAGLTVTVTNQAGATVALLDLGESYEPGMALELPGGVTITFAAGDLDGTVPDTATVPLSAEPDAQGLLAALGLNTLLRGTDAASMMLEPGIAADPDRIAAGQTGAAADGSNATRIAEAHNRSLDSLDGQTIDDDFAHLVGRVGLDSAMAARNEESATLMLESIENQRDAVSAVSQDEEAVNLIRFQQAYGMAAKFLATIQELTDLLMAL